MPIRQGPEVAGLLVGQAAGLGTDGLGMVGQNRIDPGDCSGSCPGETTATTKLSHGL